MIPNRNVEVRVMTSDGGKKTLAVSGYREATVYEERMLWPDDWGL